MKAIGGFFELELPHGGASPHPDALALSTGRACLMVLLKELKPKLVHLPVYTCAPTLEPFTLLDVRTSLYAINSRLEPTALPELGDGEYFLWTNYFGLCDDTTHELKRRYRERLIIDDTHAFFHGPHEGCWSFTSARKYFGVPDGAYLFSPYPLHVDAPRFEGASLLHNALRSMGRQQEAFRAYQEYEARLTAEVFRISAISEGLLRGVDLEKVQLRRRRNYQFLTAQLREANALHRPMGDTVPFCYPFLPKRTVHRERLYAEGFFIPRYWPELAIKDLSGYPAEKQLAEEVLPLPVDHRYTEADLMPLVQALLA